MDPPVRDVVAALAHGQRRSGGEARTAVRLEQRGWERLGEEAVASRRDRRRAAWSAITARFVQAQ